MLSLPLPGHVSQMAGFAGQPRMLPRLAETRSMWSCRRCAPCCPSLPRRRSGSPTCTPWPWCACGCGGLSCSLQVPSALLYSTLTGLYVGTAPASSEAALHPHLPAGLPPPAGPALGTELLSLLPGFLLVLSADSKLVYISENVAQVLGLSVVRPAHREFAVTVPIPILVPLLHAQHAAPADAGLWLQQPVHTRCQPGPTETGTVSEGSPLFVRWSCSPRETRSLTSWRGEWERMCTRNSSLPRRSLAGVREVSAGLVDLATLLWPLAVNREPGPALLGAE